MKTKWIGVLAVLAAFSNITFAYQKIDVPIKPQSKQQQSGIKVEFISVEELKAKIAKNESLTILDLRSQSSYEQSNQTIKGSLHTRVRKAAMRLRADSRDKEIITYCACPADEAAILAARSLQSSGFQRVRVLKGGWNAWLQAGGQVQPKHKI